MCRTRLKSMLQCTKTQASNIRDLALTGQQQIVEATGALQPTGVFEETDKVYLVALRQHSRAGDHQRLH